MTVQPITNMDRWLALLAAMPTKCKEAAKAAADKSASKFAETLGRTTPKDTSELADSIKIGPGKTPLGASVSIGEGLGYALAVEAGHMDGKTHVPPRPYFRPPLRLANKTYRGRLNRAIRKAIKEGAITDGGRLLMRSPTAPLQKAVQTALTAIGNGIVSATGAAVPVYDWVPNDPPFPFLQIGDDDVIFDTYQNSGTCLAHVNVHVFSRYQGMFEVKQIADAALEILDNRISIVGFETEAKFPEKTDFPTQTSGSVITYHAIVGIEYRLRAISLPHHKYPIALHHFIGDFFIMTTPVNTVVGGLIFVKTSFDGGSTYTHPALVNSTRSVKFTASQNAEEIVDTSNQTGPAGTYRTPKATDTSFAGAGMLDANTVVAYAGWNANNVALPCKFMIQFSNATANSMTVSGNYYLSSFSIDGDFAKHSTCTLQYDQAGPATISVA